GALQSRFESWGRSGRTSPVPAVEWPCAMPRLHPTGASSVTTPRPAAVIVLAAGEGTRMRSSTPKVLHELAGRSMLGHALVAARELEPRRLAVVVRHGRDIVAAHALEMDPGVLIADQDEVPGTGRAVQCALG